MSEKATSNDQELMKVSGRHADYDMADPNSATTEHVGWLDNGATHEAGSAGYAPETSVDLASDPFADDLADELAAKAPKRIATRTTLVLGSLVLIVVGFLGGIYIQKSYGSAGGSLPGGGAAGNFPGGAAGYGQAGYGMGQSGAGQSGAGQSTAGTTTGTIKLVDGTTIYITTSDGQVVTVKTSTSTSVKSEQSAALKDLKAGATVTVQGTAGTDGTVTATQVTAQK